MMTDNEIQGSRAGDTDSNDTGKSELIQVVQEKIVIDKEQVETGKVHIRKTVSEEVHAISVPIVNDEYEIVRVKMEPKTLMTPPDAVRQEGDTTIISVIREITVVEKRYEVIEEIHVTRHKTELPLIHEISLRTEHVQIDRKETDENQ